jgi:hypothetical protein
MTKAGIVRVLLSMVLLVACDAGRPPKPPEAPGTVPGPETTALVATLQRTGLPITFEGRAAGDWWGVGFVGARYDVYDDQLFVYEWQTVSGAETAAALIRGRGNQIGGFDISWTDVPHFYRRGRIVVLYLGRRERILKLLRGTLGPVIGGE